MNSNIEKDLEEGLEIQHFFYKNSSEFQDKILLYIDVLSELLETIHEAKVKLKFREEKTIEPLTHKFLFAASSAVYLTKETPLKIVGCQGNILDLSSCKLLLRGILENFLTFEYLFVSPKSADEELFKLRLYELSGLLSRQRLTAKDITHIEIKKNEKKQINTLLELIISDTLFQDLEKSKKAEIIKLQTKPKRFQPFTWESLFNTSIIQKSSTKEFWYHLSTHAHSEFISVLQTREFLKNLNPKEIEQEKIVILRNLITITSLYINCLKNRYKSAEIVFNAKFRLHEKEIAFWNWVARGA